MYFSAFRNTPYIKFQTSTAKLFSFVIFIWYKLLSISKYKLTTHLTTTQVILPTTMALKDCPKTTSVWAVLLTDCTEYFPIVGYDIPLTFIHKRITLFELKTWINNTEVSKQIQLPLPWPINIFKRFTGPAVVPSPPPSLLFTISSYNCKNANKLANNTSVVSWVSEL